MTPTPQSTISAERIERAIQQRYAPFPELTMELLSAQLNAFRIGDLRQCARVWEIMMERDGDLSVPAEKLFSDIARLPWQIEHEEDSDEAERHADALRYFYTHLSATSVLEADEIGGINLLLRQMMTAHAYRYSVHEMVWRIDNAGKKQVTAQFNHCPVWFFEARKGRLAYLPTEFAMTGTPLERGQWLAAVGRGLMRPCSVAYLTKWQPLSYWLLFCYRFGVPGIHGKSDASKGSEEWNDFGAALAAFANDWVTQTNRSAEISLIEASKGGSGTLPFNDLVERADRLYARAFRGGDLSTQSREGDVSGSNAQEGEKRIVLEDGGQWATDILNGCVDEPVIAQLFNTTPKAWIRIRPDSNTDSAREIAVLQAARDLGVAVSIKTARERLELPVPEEGQDLIAPPPAPAAPAGPSPLFGRTALANEASAAAQAMAQALTEDLQLYLDRFTPELDTVLEINDPMLRAEKFRQLWVKFEPLRQDLLKAPGAAGILEGINARAFAHGLARQTALANYDPTRTYATGPTPSRGAGWLPPTS